MSWDHDSNRSSGSVTLRMVAQHAGVSKSVVSRVLQQAPHVSERSRLAVEQAIQELGYRPNGTARSLSERRTRAIGVLVNDLRQPWFVDFLEGLNEGLHSNGLHAFVGDGRLDRAVDQRLLRAFLEMRVDGLVLAGTMPLTDAVQDAARWVPTVIAGSREQNFPNADVVAEDDWLGARLAVEHLVALGHRRIAHIAGPEGRVYRLRQESYERFMIECGLGDHIRVVRTELTEEAGYEAATSLLAGSSPPPTAIFGASDLTCLGALAAAKERGLSVPSELSLVGFDNSMLSRMRHVSLSSVDIQAPQVGSLAAEYLVARIATPDSPAREHLVVPHLIVRGSSGAAQQD